jgi:serine/threonine-protein kinase
MGSAEDKMPQQDPPQEAQAPTPVAHPVIADPRPPDSFWARIRRHKVVEWTLAYVAFGYALLHGVQMLRETFEWPLLVPRLTVFGLVLGAPIAVTLAWYHGHRARHRVSGPELSILIVLLLLAGSILWMASRLAHERVEVPAPAAVASSAASHVPPSVAPFNPPPHSIAVLPFVNMSGDKEQEYFSDGLSEELINSLSRIKALQVAARTSAFSFKGKDTDIATIARKLNVATVLEGSVRRSAHAVRVTAQLDSAVSGFHMWSQTFDRDWGDVLKLQTELANAVAGALLKVASLTSDEPLRGMTPSVSHFLSDLETKFELGTTRNPAAFDAYLRGSKAFSSIDDVSNLKSAITEYTEAIRLDPSYALAYAARSRALSAYATEFATGGAIREFFDKAQSDARAALKLAPELAEGHLALATYFNRGALDFTHANEAYERAAALAPGNAEILADSGRFAVIMGRFDAGLAVGRRAVALDPLGPRSRYVLAQALYLAHRDEQSVAAFGEVISLEPDHKAAYGLRGLAYYGLGDFQSARASCETKPNNWASEWCLAVTYDKLGRHADAEAMLTKLQGVYGDAGLVEYATIYAQWGNTTKALEWLTTAMRLRSPDLAYVRTDPLLEPLRNEPRFQAIERELKFPN